MDIDKAGCKMENIQNEAMSNRARALSRLKFNERKHQEHEFLLYLMSNEQKVHFFSLVGIAGMDYETTSV
jgi:hypothetical protein